jgi:50S ribosome-binding GTPase
MPDTPRIVLFGPPGAGKSSLIGALVQAGQGKSALGGQVRDVGGGMTELKEQIYKKGPSPTQEELRDYPLAVEPSPPGNGAATATLTDSSGKAAQAILASKDGLPLDKPLTQALLDADALVLVIDASAPLERNIQLMGQFLHLLQGVRGERIDVSGLPVHLVLSKCDLIAKPGDSNSKWLQRIEEAKRQVGVRFQEMLKDQARLPFGRVNLHLTATAVERPALADRGAKPEPLGVAELFRESLTSAHEHQTQREHAAGRLSLAITGMSGLVALLALLAGLLYLGRPSAELTALANQIERVLPSSSPADRLREPLDDRLQELEQIQSRPQYGQLPAALRGEVEQARAEIQQYQQFYKEFQKQVTDPRFATRDEDLDKIEKSLVSFALPEAYRAAWSNTKLVGRLEKWRDDIQLMRAAAKDEIAWIQRQIDDGDKLRAQVLEKGLPKDRQEAWLQAVQEYLDRKPRHKSIDRLGPNSSLTYDHVYKLQSVEQARKRWNEKMATVKKLRAAVVG